MYASPPSIILVDGGAHGSIQQFHPSQTFIMTLITVLHLKLLFVNIYHLLCVGLGLAICLFCVSSSFFSFSLDPKYLRWQ